MSPTAPPVRFFQTKQGHRVAYSTHGKGPPLVCPAWWVSHVEDDWADPGYQRLFGGLAHQHTVVRYDRPGAGLSDRTREQVNLAEEIEILRDLIEHLSLPRCALFAISCAGPTAIGYAAAHPDRVSKLVFFGSFLRGSDVGSREIKDALQGLIRAHWGMGSRAIANLFAPHLAESDVKRVSRLHRSSASAEMAAQLLSLTFDADGGEAARRVGAPALVLHRKQDQTVRVEAGRELAAALEYAEFHRLDGDAHVPWMGNVSEVCDSILHFLSGSDSNRDATATPTDQPNELRKQGDIWKASFAGRTVHLKHARGLTDLAILLANPGQEVHVGKLWSGADSAAALGGGADPILDDEALASFRERFRELEGAIVEAEERAAVDAAERYREERDALAKELRAAVGIGGKKRGLGEPSERARKAVTARIRSSIRKISESHDVLGAHLSDAVTTGVYCSYSPRDPIPWLVSADP